MKWLKKSPLLFGVVIFTIILSVVSFACKDTVYAEYSMSSGPDIPVLSYFFKGLSDSVYPWNVVNSALDDGSSDLSDAESAQNSESMGDAANDDDPVNAGVPESEDGLAVSADSSGDEPGKAVSGNDIEGSSEDTTYEFTEVTDDYFVDALFIGDSRTVGLSEYCEELDTRATFYSKVSLTIYTVLSKEFIKTEDGRKISIEQALTENQFSKIYIMLGLNEIGTGTSETFCEAYKEVVDRIRELQPDAIIYIQGIMHVTEVRSSSDEHFNNTNINERNEGLSKLADNRTVFYIDMNEAVDDENGNLIAELSFDDVHLKASSYERWHQYLLHNAIVKE